MSVREEIDRIDRPFPGRPVRVVAVNGAYSTGGRTDTLVRDILQETRRQLADAGHGMTATTIDVARLGQGFTGALEPDDLTPEVAAVFDQVAGADLLVAASPVFRGSYSGLFKHFFDLIDQYALADRPVLLAATGGSDRHTLMIDHELRPLFAFLQAHVAPVSVFASTGDFAGGLLLNPDVRARIELAVRGILPVVLLDVTREDRAGRRQVVDESQLPPL
jgi:FMN reductase